MTESLQRLNDSVEADTRWEGYENRKSNDARNFTSHSQSCIT